jgi:hypothetical protein
MTTVSFEGNARDGIKKVLQSKQIRKGFQGPVPADDGIEPSNLEPYF